MTGTPKAHLVCGVCEPQAKPGIKAICGAELLGVAAPLNPVECLDCLKAGVRHKSTHLVNMRR